MNILFWQKLGIHLKNVYIIQVLMSKLWNTQINV